MTALDNGRDAAFAANIGTFDGWVGGYLDSSTAFHPWSDSDWNLYRNNPKLPIFVADRTPKADARNCVDQLKALKVPKNCPVMLDLETREDDYYVEHFYNIVRPAGYRLLIYGSNDNVFANPACNGYVVAMYDNEPDNYYQWPSKVRAKQYASDVMLGTSYDADTAKSWVVSEFWK